MMSDASMCGEPKLLKEEAEEFISRTLKIDLPTSYPPSLEWINELIQAFQRRLPFQNISFLSQNSHSCVPTWEEIYREVILEGKGGLCLSLNIALTAVLLSFGVTAYNAAADYVAAKSRGVHAVTLIHRSDATETKYKHNMVTRTKSGTLKPIHYEYIDDIEMNENNCVRTTSKLVESKQRKTAYRRSSGSDIYLADVGCGYPTLQLINLRKDLKKVFTNCGLEYCVIKKDHCYVRMHRKGHDLNQGEEEVVNSEGWLPVFSFSLKPQCIRYFQHSMKCIYIDRNTSPYFTELHAVIYLNTHKMIAIKNEQLIKYLNTREGEIPTTPCMVGSGHDGEVELNSNKVRVEIKENELSEVLSKYFPMIPRWEVEKAVCRYLCAQEKSDCY